MEKYHSLSDSLDSEQMAEPFFDFSSFLTFSIMVATKN